MGSRKQSVIDNLGFLLAKRLERLRGGKPDAKLALEACRFSREEGCGALLARYDADAFFLGLFRSGCIYLDLLQRKAECPEDDRYYLARSKGQPLLDAIAANAWDLAKAIIPLMACEWMARMEPEEDFSYFGVLSGLVMGSGGVEDGLEDFERSLKGGESPRLKACRALADRDPEAFEAGLLALIDDRAHWIEDDRRSGIFDPYLHATEAQVFVEGIALVRLARAGEMHTERQYRFIPEVTLGAPGVPLPSDFSNI